MKWMWIALVASTAKPMRVAAWRCTSTDELGETGSDRVLGKTMCVQRVGGKMSHGLSFTKCGP